MLKVEPEGLTLLAREAFRDVAFLQRTSHLEKVAAIPSDMNRPPTRGGGSGFVDERRSVGPFRASLLPGYGTATIIGKKGQQVWTGAQDEEFLARGCTTPTPRNLRYSQTIPLTMYEEKNSGTNLPAQIDLYAAPGMEYHFLFVAKGGGSANKTFLYQETKALLNPAALEKFLIQKMVTLGTAACPPYHLAFVVGGTSAESCLKTVKLASAGYLDGASRHGKRRGPGVPRPGHGRTGVGGGAALWHRSPVWRQTFRPGCPGHPPASPWGLLPGRHGSVLLRGPQHQGLDRPPGNLAGTTGSQSRPVHSRPLVASRNTEW